VAVVANMAELDVNVEESGGFADNVVICSSCLPTNGGVSDESVRLLQVIDWRSLPCLSVTASLQTIYKRKR